MLPTQAIIIKYDESIPYHKIVLAFSNYSINDVQIRLKDIELEHALKNFENTKAKMEKEFNYDYQSDFEKNDYAPQKEADGIMEVNFFELIHRIKRKLNE